MAIDADTRLKVQVVYESNNWSAREVKEYRFADIEEIKQKTIESWISKYKWIKNRFASEKEAIEELIESSLPLEEAKSIIKNKMENEVVEGEIVNDDDGDDDKYSEAMARELSYQVLNVHSLQAEMARNLDSTKELAKNSKSIGVKKTYHDMLTKTYEVVHGKNINITPKDPNDKTLSSQEIKEKSDEELDRLIKGS